LANTKSAQKRIRTNERKHDSNTSYRSRVKTMVRKAEQLIFSTKSSAEDSAAAVREAASALDKAAVKGILHKNNAARRKSRLMKKLNKAA
jgi:small subunit ribosomal protein S20